MIGRSLKQTWSVWAALSRLIYQTFQWEVWFGKLWSDLKLVISNKGSGRKYCWMNKIFVTEIFVLDWWRLHNIYFHYCYLLIKQDDIFNFNSNPHICFGFSFSFPFQNLYFLLYILIKIVTENGVDESWKANIMIHLNKQNRLQFESNVLYVERQHT